MRKGHAAIAIALLALAAAAGCGTLREGQQQSDTFTSPVAANALRDRAQSWLLREGYVLVAGGPTLVRAEKQRTGLAGGAQLDMVSVFLEGVPEGTRVRVQGQTDRMESGRRASAEVSFEMIQDVHRLTDDLQRLSRPV